MANVYNTANGVKPRYDNGGTEFGAMHRDLGPGYYMFDIDRMSAIIETQLEWRRQNQGFIEYRIVKDNVIFTALLELKGHKTKWSLEALNNKTANSRARLAMAQALKCRLFIVFATYGKQPFEFWEIDTTNSESKLIGTLSYSNGDRMEQVRRFWRDCLGLYK